MDLGHWRGCSCLLHPISPPTHLRQGQASLLEECLRAQGRALLGLKGRVAGLVVLIACGSILASVWGTLGMAVATIVAQAIVLIVIVFAARDHFRNADIRLLIPRFQDISDLTKYLTRRLKPTTRTS